MAFNVSAYINDTVLCGKKGFVIWDNETNSFGHCFQDLVLLIPTQVDNQKKHISDLFVYPTYIFALLT